MNETGPITSESREIARQAQVELELLLTVEGALRSALAWPTHERGNNRKLATLRFHAASFERHVTRIQALADHGGYLRVITDANPHLSEQVETLRNECAVLHGRLEHLIVRLDHVSGDDGAAFGELCADLDSFLDSMRAHGQSECALLQESFIQEVGGSG